MNENWHFRGQRVSECVEKSLHRSGFFFSSADGMETINEARRCLPLQID